jgi:hypothetical protein
MVTQNTLKCYTAIPSLQPPIYEAWIPTAPTVLVSLIAVYAVHRFTKFRDHEKLLDDFYGKIEKAADDVAESAFLAWSEKKGPERLRHVALTKSRIQKLGSLTNRLELVSPKWRIRWRLKWPYFVYVEIKMGKEIVDFRKEITLDPFEDPSRHADIDRAINCESAKSIFLLNLDLKYRNWISPF